jgi:hypothetical protein
MIKIKGKVRQVLEVEQISDKFSKRSFVMTDNAEFQNVYLITCVNKSIKLLDSVTPGSEITAEVIVKGREWTSPQGVIKYFTTLECYDITTHQHSDSVAISSEPIKDDLPF